MCGDVWYLRCNLLQAGAFTRLCGVVEKESVGEIFPDGLQPHPEREFRRRKSARSTEFREGEEQLMLVCGSLLRSAALHA